MDARDEANADEDQGLDASPLPSPDGGFVSDKGDGGQRGDVASAMAVYSGEGQTDDQSGNDAAQVLMQPEGGAEPAPDGNPHGPN